MEQIAMPSPLFHAKDVTIRYGSGCPYCISGGELQKNRCPRCRSVWALNGVSFDLYPGEVLGIVGESGSGKSTLMQSLYFDIPVTSGELYLESFRDGSENLFQLSQLERRDIRNRLLGMVYQNPVMGLRMNFSSAGNIAEKLIAAGERRVGVMTDRVKELLNYVQIQHTRMKEPPKNFSGGMQQRIQISKALANNPPILLLDEVTTGLDLSVQARVLDLIRLIRQIFGVSIILVSHDLAVIRMLSDRTMVLLDGKLVEQGLTDQILDDPQHAYTQQLVHALI